MQAPWVEKHRPQSFSDIVLDEANIRVLKGLSTLENMPHMLFYGPPGTGKTTVAEILIASRPKKLDPSNILRLNASDQRGLVCVKSAIVPFVQSSSVHRQNEKVVVLDEADYMTPQAHAALFRLVKLAPPSVTLIILCNYLFRMYHPLQSCLTCIHFRSPPKPDIIAHVGRIMRLEKQEAPARLRGLVDLYYPDIRSIINACQNLTPCSTPDVDGQSLFATAKEMQTSPLRVATSRMERILQSDLPTNWLLQAYCDFLKMSATDPDTALSYFINFVSPNLDDSFDQEST